MNKRIFLFLIFLILAVGACFLLYHNNKDLKYIPKNADVVVLVDVKKLERKYISAFVTNPSQWSSLFEKDDKSISIKNSGVEIPDFVQIFHLKDASFSDWNTVLELKDKDKFVNFLKQRKFIKKGENLYQSKQLFIQITDEKCWISTSEITVQNLHQLFLKSESSKNFNADQFISNSVASVSHINNDEIENFSIDFFADAIEIKNTSTAEKFAKTLGNLKKQNHFLNLELDEKNVKGLARIFNQKKMDSAQINFAKAVVEIEQVNDTIITYRYDDDFNEIEEKSVQKLLQPNYAIVLSSLQPKKTWEYFQHKNWINAQDQFVRIPFQPNRISLNSKNVLINSLRKPILLPKKTNQNYIFIRNSELLFSSIKSLSATEQKFISRIDYIFFGNQSKEYYLRIKLKEEKLPFILR